MLAVGVGRILFGAGRPGVENIIPQATTNGRPDPERTAPIASMARRSVAAAAGIWEKSWLYARWITPSAPAAPFARLSGSSSEP